MIAFIRESFAALVDASCTSQRNLLLGCQRQNLGHRRGLLIEGTKEGGVFRFAYRVPSVDHALCGGIALTINCSYRYKDYQNIQSWIWWIGLVHVYSQISPSSNFSGVIT